MVEKNIDPNAKRMIGENQPKQTPGIPSGPMAPTGFALDKEGTAVGAPNVVPKIIEGPLADLDDEGLDAMVEKLLTKIEPHKAQRLREVAREVYQRPLWQILLGYYELALDRSIETGVLIAPQWDEGEKPKSKSICQFCDKEFQAERLGQLYCSAKCGAAVEFKKAS